jgi:hypothetical protein
MDLGPLQDGPLRCPLCSDPVMSPEGIVAIRWCQLCDAAHHLDCWRLNDCACASPLCSMGRPLTVIDEAAVIPFEEERRKWRGLMTWCIAALCGSLAPIAGLVVWMFFH